MGIFQKIIVGAFFLLAFALVGCNYDNSDCDNADTPPGGCQIQSPGEGELTLYLSGERSSYIPIKIYREKLDNGSLIIEDTVYNQSSVTYTLPLGRYTATAEYHFDGKNVIAVDEDVIREKTREECGYTCYSIKEGTLNLRLKY